MKNVLKEIIEFEKEEVLIDLGREIESSP